MTPELDHDQLRDLESIVRRRLHEEADVLVPDDRLADIRDGTKGLRGRRPDWLWPVTTAAAVAVLAVGVWATLVRGTDQPPVVGGPTTPVMTSTAPLTTTSPSPATSATLGTSAPPATSATRGTPAPPATSTATSPTAAPVVSGTLPAYFVEPVSAGRYGIVRDFVPVASAPPLGTVAAAEGAARLSMTGTPQHLAGAPVPAWDPSTTVTVTPGSATIGVVLSRAGRTALPAEQQRLAVQQLVWAVTGGLQQVRPVALSVASGGPVFPTMPAGVYQRPAPDQAYRDVAPVWVDSPANGTTVSSGTGLRVTGQACTFEAVVAWVVERDGRQVRSGSTKASSGCPVMGSWSVTLPPLPAGSYVFHARELSAADGSVSGDQVVRFTSR